MSEIRTGDFRDQLSIKANGFIYEQVSDDRCLMKQRMYIVLLRSQ